jgi:predicted transposase YbfD/YdcC
MKLRPKITLTDHFAELTDPRSDRTKEHKLIDIVTIAICAVICGADTWVGIETSGQAKYKWLKQFLELPNGIPSHDTFSRVFARLDGKEFQSCFLNWVKSISQLIPGEVISIDGKTLRHSYDTESNKKAIHMVSAWASDQKLVLGQRKVDEKSNEITAIPELIKVLELSGCLVTIDAMGTQKDIAKLIIAKGADYCLALKGNQGNIHQDVEQLFKQALSQQWQNINHSFFETVEKGHGRIEKRRYWTMGNVEFLIDSDKWVGLESIGMVESERIVSGETSSEIRYDLNSFRSNAQVFAHAVRSHWGVENCLHWVLDLGFREDDCRIRKDNAPENFALLRHIAFNLLSQEKTAKIGIQNKRLQAAWDNDYLAQVLSI